MNSQKRYCVKIRKKIEPDFNSRFWDFFTENVDKRFIVLVGGAGSSKSHSTAQLFIKRLYEEKNKVFLVVRKTFPALKLTAMQLILDLLNEYNLPYDLVQSPITVITVGSNKMIFRGLDDPEKVKSLDANYIWMEEASDFTKDDFKQLNLRLRRFNIMANQIYMTLNPVDKEFSFVHSRFIDKESPRAAVMNSTWRDNILHLDKEYVEELEALISEDETYYQIYNLGLWGVLKNIIYTNWDMVDVSPAQLGDRFYGLDFGFVNPTALIEVRYVEGEIYEKELLYKTHLTNTDLIQQLNELIPNKTDPIYADSAEPARIQEIRLKGFNIFAGQKDKKLGIDFVKRFKTHIVKPSINLEKEKKVYSYRMDKNGIVLEEPVDFFNHSMDAERYAIFTHLWRRLRKRLDVKHVTKEMLGVP